MNVAAFESLPLKPPVIELRRGDCLEALTCSERAATVTSGRKLVALLQESMRHRPEMWSTGPGLARHVSGLELKCERGLGAFTENSDVRVPLGLGRRLALGSSLRRLFRRKAAILLSECAEETSAVQALCAAMRDDPEAWEVFADVLYHPRTGTSLEIGRGLWGLQFTFESRLRFSLGTFERICVWLYVRRLIARSILAKLERLGSWQHVAGRAEEKHVLR